MNRLALILCLFVLLGCSAHEVPATYRPLEQIKERLGIIGSKTAISTVGRTAWVADLDAWLERNPPGSAKYHAVLRHEQEHSRRQIDSGSVTRWVARYVRDEDFRWAEEQIGWYWQITELRRRGQLVHAEGVARILSGSTYDMVSYDVALKWVRDVLSGRWKPPAD